jgi:hypothetical protein
MSLRPESWRPWTEPRAIAVVVICAAAVWCTSIVVGGWRATHGNDTPRTIDVTGEASRHVVPDHASWTITVRDNAEDRDASVKAARDKAEMMRTFLKGHGITDAEIAIKQPETAAEVEDDGSTTSSFDTSIELVVESSDAAKVMKAYEQASNTGNLDADMENPTCTSSSSKLEAELLSEARRNARAKAEAALADYGGAQVGRLFHAEVGDFSGGNDCGGTDATATATATYELE